MNFTPFAEAILEQKGLFRWHSNCEILGPVNRLVLLFIVCGLLFVAQGAWAQESCVSAQCHATILHGKNVHPATESCESCHESIETSHPQKGKKTFKLTAALPELCSTCHDAFGQKKDVHPPVKDGECTTCHDPHSSDEPKLLVQPVKDLCTSCHGDKQDFKFVHGPASAGDCTACHTPHESDIKPLLVKETTELCETCHEEIAVTLKKKDVHPAIDSGCTTCHNPHGGDFKKLLVSEGKELCFQCHSEIGENIGKAAIVHPPIETEQACASCHSPHASDHPKLLIKEGSQLCLACHKTLINKTMTVLHGPIKDGTCTACHDPHSSGHPNLLIKQFPQEEYVSYKPGEYELCFSCHNADLVAFPDTSFATQFRDGERNLHYLHVNKTEKGRSCRMCHNVHGSSNSKLIADSVPFGKWNLRLNFESTETGGTCTPGCHKKQAYDRNKK